MQKNTEVHKRISYRQDMKCWRFGYRPSVRRHPHRSPDNPNLSTALWKTHIVPHFNIMNHTCLCGKAVWTVGFRQHSSCRSLWTNFETSNESALLGIGMYFRLEVHPNGLFWSLLCTVQFTWQPEMGNYRTKRICKQRGVTKLSKELHEFKVKYQFTLRQKMKGIFLKLKKKSFLASLRFNCVCPSICNSSKTFLISTFRRVLNVVCFLPGNSLASEFCVPTFRNTLPVPSS
jgi:hypothetical protein